MCTCIDLHTYSLSPPWAPVVKYCLNIAGFPLDHVQGLGQFGENEGKALWGRGSDGFTGGSEATGLMRITQAKDSACGKAHRWETNLGNGPPSI